MKGILTVAALLCAVFIITLTYTPASADDDKKHSTRFFFIHHGPVFVSPYTIKQDPTTKEFKLENSSSTDSNYFMEAYGRHRHAFLGIKCEGICLDFDGRLGFVAGKQDAIAAVAKGAGNAYFDMSVGFLVNFKKGKKFEIRNHNLDTKQPDSILTYSINPEIIVGGVTDKENQDINLHYGAGISFLAGIPMKVGDKDRKTEMLLGLYYGEADLPIFKDTNTKVLEKEHGYARYDSETVYIFKGEFNIPRGEEGYWTIASKFFKKSDGKNINPWTVSVGVTMSLNELADGLRKTLTAATGGSGKTDEQ